jgi:hypothetical protein
MCVYMCAVRVCVCVCVCVCVQTAREVEKSPTQTRSLLDKSQARLSPHRHAMYTCTTRTVKIIIFRLSNSGTKKRFLLQKSETFPAAKHECHVNMIAYET